MDSVRRPSSAPRLGARAVRRLAIAARFMRWPEGGAFDELAARKVLAAIGRMEEARRERLRGLVDWVEAHERLECESMR